MLTPGTRRAYEISRQVWCPVLGLLVAALTAATIRAQAPGRPPVVGRTAAVSAGHPLTAAAAFETLTKGGNAFDAGVTAMLVGGVVEQDLYSLGGEGTPSSTPVAMAG